jgi:hypothetical protein
MMPNTTTQRRPLVVGDAHAAVPGHQVGEDRAPIPGELLTAVVQAAEPVRPARLVGQARRVEHVERDRRMCRQ